MEMNSQFHTSGCFNCTEG